MPLFSTKRFSFFLFSNGANGAQVLLDLCVGVKSLRAPSVLAPFCCYTCLKFTVLLLFLLRSSFLSLSFFTLRGSTPFLERGPLSFSLRTYALSRKRLALACSRGPALKNRVVAHSTRESWGVCNSQALRLHRLDRLQPRTGTRKCSICFRRRESRNRKLSHFTTSSFPPIFGLKMGSTVFSEQRTW